MKVNIYASQHCEPCKKIQEDIKKGNYTGDVRTVNIETDEGFREFMGVAEDALEKGVAGVPMAYDTNGNYCKIGWAEDGTLTFECNEGKEENNQ